MMELQSQFGIAASGRSGRTRQVLFVDWAPLAAAPEAEALRRFVRDALGGERIRARQRILPATPLLIDAAWSAAERTPPGRRTSAQRTRLALSDALVGEVFASDAVALTVCVDDARGVDAFGRWVDLLGRSGLTLDGATREPTGRLDGVSAIVGGWSRVGATPTPAAEALRALRDQLAGLGFSPVQTAQTAPRRASVPLIAEARLRN